MPCPFRGHESCWAITGSLQLSIELRRLTPLIVIITGTCWTNTSITNVSFFSSFIGVFIFNYTVFDSSARVHFGSMWPIYHIYGSHLKYIFKDWTDQSWLERRKLYRETYGALSFGNIPVIRPGRRSLREIPEQATPSNSFHTHKKPKTFRERQHRPRPSEIRKCKH